MAQSGQPLIQRMEAASFAPTPAEIASFPNYGKRYRLIVWFFSSHFARFMWWEVAAPRILGRKFVDSRRDLRLRLFARRFRNLAIEMGGVMIKLGQFVSTRVDILPEIVIEELQGLQDEVPPLPFSEIEAVLHEELGTLADDIENMQPTPIAAASLGQVYRATLDGEKVVVKVQRRNIRGLVYTDLQALRVVARRAMRFGFIRRRANVPELLEEFGRVLWEELDYLNEARNARRFQQMFANDTGVYVPKVYETYTNKRVLVEEDVTTIKLNDYAALEDAGIDRHSVAQRLLDTYLTQIFKERFFHADPHPGNIFIYPLDWEQANDMDNHKLGTGVRLKGRPFYLIFVDYGMVGRLTTGLVESLRQTMISMGLRDARTMINSYERMGLLMPGTDKERLIAATNRAFDMVWGRNMTEMGNMSVGEVQQFALEYQDIMKEMPFRIPQDMIYLGRCAGILSGMCTGLDPKFDPWVEMQPYVSTLIEAGNLDETSDQSRVWEDWQQFITADNLRALLSEDNIDTTLRTGSDYLRRALQLPIMAEEVLRKAERGDLETRFKMDADLQQRLDRMERGNARIVNGIVFAALLLAGSILWTSDAEALGIVAFIFGGITWLRIML